MLKIYRFIIIFLLFIICSFAIHHNNIAQNAQNISTSPNNEDLYTVVRVIDGDTLDIAFHNHIKRIRIIGIDTPETVKHNHPIECYGKEATLQAEKMLLYQKIKLQKDTKGDDIDIYNRLLRHVILKNGENFGAFMVQNGYAKAYKKFEYETKKEFLDYEKDAQKNKKGMWEENICNKKTKELSNKKEKNIPLTEEKSTCKIKGNISSSGKKIYHLPSQRYYKRTFIDTKKGEKYFCTEEEAQQNGFLRSKV
jgi:micrococcal nuclease